MGRPQVVGVCIVLLALAVTGGALALIGFAIGVMGGTALTHLLGLGGAALSAAASVTLLGTGLSPREAEDIQRVGQVLRVLIPASAALSLTLLAVLTTD